MHSNFPFYDYMVFTPFLKDFFCVVLFSMSHKLIIIVIWCGEKGSTGIVGAYFQSLA